MKLKILSLFLLILSCERLPEDDNIKFNMDDDAVKINISQHHINDKTVLIIDRIFYHNSQVLKVSKSFDTIPSLGMSQDTFYVEEHDKDTIIKSIKNYKLYISTDN